jgi:hypothetical protein
VSARKPKPPEGDFRNVTLDGSRPRLVQLGAADVEQLLGHARARQTRSVDGGGAWQFWTRVIAALVDARRPL